MITFWDEPIYDLKDFKFFIYQKEKCPETGRIHYQGYCEFKEKKSFKCIKKIFGDDKIHIEPRMGSQMDAIAYCSKEETREDIPIKVGKPSQQGHRSDLDSICDAIEARHTKREILLQFRGNALRHISHICKAVDIYWDKDKTDREILQDRKFNPYNPLHECGPECMYMQLGQECDTKPKTIE